MNAFVTGLEKGGSPGSSWGIAGEWMINHSSTPISLSLKFFSFSIYPESSSLSISLASSPVSFHPNFSDIHLWGQLSKELEPLLATIFSVLNPEFLIESTPVNLASFSIVYCWASPVAQTIKSLPAVQETQLQFLGWGKSPGEGNDNLLQYSCLENGEEPGRLQSLG